MALKLITTLVIMSASTQSSSCVAKAIFNCAINNVQKESVLVGFHRFSEYNIQARIGFHWPIMIAN